MRTILLALLLSLTLVACGTKDETVVQPAPDAAPAAGETQTPEPPAPAQNAEGRPTSTNVLNDVAPDGPVGSLQLINGTSIEINELIKLGNYYLYISGKLNGRSSTVISLTRFRDLQRWEGISFKNKNEFTITSKQGKEMAFTDAHLYLGNGSPDTYTFTTLDDRYNKVPMTVKKDDVAAIKIR